MVQVETQQTISGLQGKVADIQVCGSSVLQCREPNHSGIGNVAKSRFNE